MALKGPAHFDVSAPMIFTFFLKIESSRCLRMQWSDHARIDNGPSFAYTRENVAFLCLGKLKLCDAKVSKALRANLNTGSN